MLNCWLLNLDSVRFVLGISELHKFFLKNRLVLDSIFMKWEKCSTEHNNMMNNQMKIQKQKGLLLKML